MDLGHEKPCSINFLERCLKHPLPSSTICFGIMLPASSSPPPPPHHPTDIFIKFLLKPWKGKIFPAVKALTCRLVFFSDF